MSFLLLFQSSFNINLHINFYHINEVVIYITYTACYIYTVLMHYHYMLHWLMLHLLHLFFYKAFFEAAICQTNYKVSQNGLYTLPLFVLYLVYFEGAINLVKLSYWWIKFNNRSKAETTCCNHVHIRE